MPEWSVHEHIAQLDGIDRRIMHIVNKMIDTFHQLARRGELRGINPEEAEWALVDVVFSSINNVRNEYERVMGLKAAAHHYVLDYLEKMRMHVLISIAYEEGLNGVYRYLQQASDKEVRSVIASAGIISGIDAIKEQLMRLLSEWYKINKMEDPSELGNAALQFAELLKSLPRP